MLTLMSLVLLCPVGLVAEHSLSSLSFMSDQKLTWNYFYLFFICICLVHIVVDCQMIVYKNLFVLFFIFEENSAGYFL